MKRNVFIIIFFSLCLSILTSIGSEQNMNNKNIISEKEKALQDTKNKIKLKKIYNYYLKSPFNTKEKEEFTYNLYRLYTGDLLKKNEPYLVNLLENDFKNKTNRKLSNHELNNILQKINIDDTSKITISTMLLTHSPKVEEENYFLKEIMQKYLESLQTNNKFILFIINFLTIFIFIYFIVFLIKYISKIIKYINIFYFDFKVELEDLNFYTNIGLVILIIIIGIISYFLNLFSLIIFITVIAFLHEKGLPLFQYQKFYLFYKTNLNEDNISLFNNKFLIKGVASIYVWLLDENGKEYFLPFNIFYEEYYKSLFK